MNDTAKRIIEDRMRNGYRGRDYAEYPSDRRDYSGHMEYRGEVNHDGRRGVYGTGRYGVGGRDRGGDSRDGDYRGGDYRGGDSRGGDYRGGDSRGRDYGDYHSKHEEIELSKSDVKRWKKMLKNGDGTTGEHFTGDQIYDAARQIGVNYEDYDEKDLCMTANMLYSDLCEALHSMIPKDKEAVVYTKMAKCWLEDNDGPKGSEKLALYFYCIVDDEE